MADDGLMLNFELPSDAFTAPRTKIKGGSWKDRLTARKSAEYGRQKAKERALNPDDVSPKPSEETKSTGAIAAAQSRNAQMGRPAKRARTANDVLPKSINGEVITSLFSFNKQAEPVTEPVANDEEPVEPTNAPLKDGDETAKFTSIGLSDTLASHLQRKLHINAPTAIQRKAVKLLCENDTDAFVQAQTGSGKTLAYLLPIVERISTISRRMKADGENFTRHSGLFAIVLAPTRELSKQISNVLEGLLDCYRWIVPGTVIGGEQKQREKARLRKGVNILVATPGRLVDHLANTEVLDLCNVRWLVLDEGDRLVELGFDQDIQKIISVLNLRARKKLEKAIPGLPDRRTTVLCSATIKADVERLRSISLEDPVSISVDANEQSEMVGGGLINFTAPAQLKQSYVIAPPKQRLVTLVAILKQTFKRKGSVMKCIVFMSCADSVDFHFELLTQGDKGKEDGTPVETEDPLKNVKSHQSSKGGDKHRIAQGNTIIETRTAGIGTIISSSAEHCVNVYRLHGSLQQATRTSTLKAFSTSTEPAVLVCTDVASRGLDLPNVDLVIEYDPPFSKDDHIHRIGRTARAGNDGRAMIFLQPGCEERYVEILKESKPRNLTRHDAEDLIKKGFSSADDKTSGNWEQLATDYQLDVERWAIEHPKHLEQARRAYQSHIRAYATHVSAERGIFNMQELHLGHLAKAFALRDKPGAIRVPGMRPGVEGGKKGRAVANSKKKSNREDGGGRDDVVGDVDEAAARRKMTAMSKMMGNSGANEFNLG